jgi:hypothetical protein
MSEPLEGRLRQLGAALDVPPEPDLVSAVRGRLEPRPPVRTSPPVPARRPRAPRSAGGIRSVRRTLALALGLTFALAGGAFALTPTRDAILDFFGLDGATVQRVDRLPPLPVDAPRGLELGRRIPLDQARHAASFRALLPSEPADAAYLAPTPVGGRISLVAGPVVITQFRGGRSPYLRKFAGPGTRIARVRVDGLPGLYLSGEPHEVAFADIAGDERRDTLALAGDVLMWERDGLLLRIEGASTLPQALAIGRSLR